MNHSPFGYSAVSTFEQCPYKYKLQYIDGLETLPSQDPANALIIGTALHRGIETDVDTAIQEYFNSYPIIDDKHIDEEIKLRYLIPKVKGMIPEGIHEVQVIDTNFMGTLDMLVPLDGDDNWSMLPPDTEEAFDLYDFKYSNHNDRYIASRQLHLYKYYFEKLNHGKKIRNMYFVFVPKVQIRQKKTETTLGFRQRLQTELDRTQVKGVFIDYDPRMVIDHLELTQQIMRCQNFEKNQTNLCDWCDYKKFCLEGDFENMALPSTQDVAVTISNHKKVWFYG